MEEFAVHFKKYHHLEKEVQNEESKKQAELLDFHRKQAEREKNHAIERAKHQATEQLLHNVLPPSIANKMLGGTKLIAEKSAVCRCSLPISSISPNSRNVLPLKNLSKD